MLRVNPEGDGMPRRKGWAGDDHQRDADVRDLITALCPEDEIHTFVRDTLRNGGRVILPCNCDAMITTRLDRNGDAIVSHYTDEGKYEASISIPAALFGTKRGSLLLHEWIHAHHARNKTPDTP